MKRGKGSPFETTPFIKKVSGPVILPTVDDLTDWIYRINIRLRKEKEPEKRRRLNVIKEEFKSLKENL